jgi:hypothetical protein
MSDGSYRTKNYSQGQRFSPLVGTPLGKFLAWNVVLRESSGLFVEKISYSSLGNFTNINDYDMVFSLLDS